MLLSITQGTDSVFIHDCLVKLELFVLEDFSACGKILIFIKTSTYDCFLIRVACSKYFLAYGFLPNYKSYLAFALSCYT